MAPAAKQKLPIPTLLKFPQTYTRATGMSSGELTISRHDRASTNRSYRLTAATTSSATATALAVRRERGTLARSFVREDAVTPEQVRALARAWWLAVALGLLSLIAGGLVLARPDHSLRAVAATIGIFVLIDGAVELYLSLAGRVEDRATAALLAIVNVIVGVLLIRHPIAGVQAIALFIGIWLIAVGVLRGLAALDTPAPRLGRLSSRGSRSSRGQ